MTECEAAADCCEAIVGADTPPRISFVRRVHLRLDIYIELDFDEDKFSFFLINAGKIEERGGR